MIITYFSRNKEAGYSIGKVSETYINIIRKMHITNEYFMPNKFSNPISIFGNVIYALMHKNKNGVIHITGSEHYLLLFLLNSKTVVTVHDLGFYTQSTSKIKRIWKLAFWIFPLKFANKIVCISDFTKKTIQNIINISDNKFEIIPNSIGSEFEFVYKKFNTNKPIVLHIGTGSNKNLDNTIIALSKLDIHLRIVGRLNSEQIAKLQNYKIEFSNVYNLTDEEVLKEYVECDIVNFPSTHEGFGMPIIEGQSIGRAVVTSNISPMKEILNDETLLVDPYNTDDIRLKYELLINNEELYYKTVEKGLENVKRFNREHIAHRYLNVYKEILK